MKRKIYFWAKNYVNSENVKLVLMLIPMAIILVQQFLAKEFDWTEFFDVGILMTFLILVFSDFVVDKVQKIVAVNTEDQAKVTSDYKALVKKYGCMKLVEYHGVVFPEECLYIKKAGMRIEIKDKPEKYYNLPSQVADNSKELMEAHSASTIYNQINIRMDDLTIEGDCVTLHTSRTQYFDSLLTNRCCDYVFGDRKMTVRELYEPGPFLKPLRLSKLSNHLGFNGFVITKDDKIPFILRKGNLSIAKHTWATSIGASMKAKYALDSENGYVMSQDSLAKSVIAEIKDELQIKNDVALTIEKAQESIFAFYRDLVEGGKPQFLFVLQLEEVDSVELRGCIEKNKIDKKDVITDGDDVVFFTLEELKQATFEVNKMIVANQEYPMAPSSLVSVVLLLKYLE